jgi:hypothetical protein
LGENPKNVYIKHSTKSAGLLLLSVIATVVDEKLICINPQFLFEMFDVLVVKLLLKKLIQIGLQMIWLSLLTIGCQLAILW